MNKFSTQQGSTLIVALVILLIMTMLSIAGMQGTILEEKMAGNMADRNVALQSAEAALREAEAIVEPLLAEPTPVTSCSTPPCQIWVLGSAGDLTTNSDDWWNEQAEEFGVDGEQEFALANADPRYFIEYQSFEEDDLASGSNPPTGRTFYRITARGQGTSSTAVVILQATYAKRYN
jgi:type IV pilus assembly protein PilX